MEDTLLRIAVIVLLILGIGIAILGFGILVKMVIGG